MTQPPIKGTGHGIPRMVFGSDGTDWIALLVDALGHLQVDILSSLLPTGAATAANQTTMITALQLIDDLRTALASVATDQIRADIISSALPTGAATETTLALIKGYVDGIETLLSGGLPAALDTGALKVKEQSPLTGFATSANQTTMITALQLIDDLRNALGSVATDLLRVESKSGDKIFGFESVVEESVSDDNLAAGENVLNGTPCPSGKIQKITIGRVAYVGTVTGVNLILQVVGLGGGIVLIDQTSIVNGRTYLWQGDIYLQVGDYLRCIIYGATAGDDGYFGYAGLQMNVP